MSDNGINGGESTACAHCGKVTDLLLAPSIEGELLCLTCAPVYDEWLETDGERSITDESGLL